MLDPVSLIAFGYVALGAFIVESGVAALLLLGCGLLPHRVLLVLFLYNAVVFFFIFNPLIQRSFPWQAGEALIVVMDAIAIKFLPNFDWLQTSSGQYLGWKRAFIVSVAVNSISFFVGVIASGTPWHSKNFDSFE
jgi:hypothetical protein